jgi:ribosomal protein L11 methyltransferase
LRCDLKSHERQSLQVGTIDLNRPLDAKRPLGYTRAMLLWSKLAEPRWIEANEQAAREYAGNDLTIIERHGHKRSRLEVACKSKQQAQALIKNLGGRIEKLPRGWAKQLLRNQRVKPLKIGMRLVIDRSPFSRSGGFQTAGAIWRSPFLGPAGKRPVHLVIPAGAAFGTGEHATTAMSLRLFERITRDLEPGWSVADLGTGSGVFALASKCFGAARVVAIDIDPVAISTARANARLNKLGGIDFRVADVRKWRATGKLDIIIANLFSELLIEILPSLRAKLRRDGWLILSGVLRSQERELICALRLNRIDIVRVRRRGKWIATLCRGAL